MAKGIWQQWLGVIRRGPRVLVNLQRDLGVYNPAGGPHIRMLS